MSFVLRVGLAAVGLLFLTMSIRGIINPLFFTETFGVAGEGAARNTLRADFGAFFLVGSIPTIWTALQPSRVHWLIIPALFLGAVLALRIVGVIMGDIPNMMGMVVEAVALVVIFAAQRAFAVQPKQG